MRRSWTAVVALALVLAVAPAAQAVVPGTAIPVSGGWTWVNTGATVESLPDGSLRISGTEVGAWTGTFRGTSTDVFQMTQTPPVDDPDHWGPGWGTLTASFTGKVGVKNGTMTMHVTFWWAADDLIYHGTWAILSGTGALKHVTGSGTWVSGIDASAMYVGTVYWK